MPWAHPTGCQPPLTDCSDLPPVQQEVVLYGGGYAGRLTPMHDVTTDEAAHGADNDNEGTCGGWVLQLVPMHAAGEEHSLDTSALLGGGVVRQAPILRPVTDEGVEAIGIANFSAWVPQLRPCRMFEAADHA